MSERLVFALALGVALVPGWCIGQNLVPNPSFEDYDTCPDWLSQIDRATGWQAFRLTPDYMNACDLTDTMSVPLNLFGYQQASDGIGYAGIHNYSSSTPNTREFIGAQLDEPLFVGQPVYVSMKVALGGYSPTSYRMRWTTNNVGLRFSMNSFYQVTGSLPNSSAVHMLTILTDTMNWHTVSGVYFPDSAYEYVQIGNFYSDALTSVLELDDIATYPYSYTYVDEVCVAMDPGVCDIESSVVVAGNTTRPLLVWPNPFSNELYVDWDQSIGVQRLTLLDMTGRILQSWDSEGVMPPFRVSIPSLPEGLYQLQTLSESRKELRSVIH